MQYNERDYILQSQAGSSEAFGRIYDQHVRTIYNFIYYKVFDKDTAEDLTSLTFFKALKNVRSVDPERSIISWLYKIAHNSILDHYRSVRQTEDIEDFWDIQDEDINVVGKLDVEVDMKRVGHHLKKLSSLERDIIFMRVWQELPYEVIAEVVAKSQANCKMIYSRALKKLKSMLPNE